MKKNKLALVAFLLIITTVFSALSIVAIAEAVETPMIPILPDFTEPDIIEQYATLKLTTDAGETVSSGDIIKVSVNVVNIASSGLGKLDLGFVYSKGLEFLDDLKVVGLPSSWSVSTPDVTSNRVKFTLEDTASTPATSNITITFSLKVGSNPQSYLTVDFKDVSLYDADKSEVDSFVEKTTNNSFSAVLPVPTFTNLGASLRINNTPALRFGMRVPKDDSFKGIFKSGQFSYTQNSNVKFGMVVIEKSLLTGDLTVDTPGALSQIFTTPLSENSQEVIFAYEVGNVTDYSKTYAFCPFVMHRNNSNSSYEYIYGEVKTRSARSVATTALNYETDNTKSKLLQNFIK